MIDVKKIETISKLIRYYITSSLKILAVRKIPISGKPFELLDYEGISRDSIIFQVKNFINRNSSK